MTDHTHSDGLINEIESIINSYVQCWETGENHFIMPTIPGGIVDSPLFSIGGRFLKLFAISS